jgi:hypothetical protein
MNAAFISKDTLCLRAALMGYNNLDRFGQHMRRLSPQERQATDKCYYTALGYVSSITNVFLGVSSEARKLFPSPLFLDSPQLLDQLSEEY